VAIAAPLMRDIKIAANQVATESAAVIFRFANLHKKWKMAG